MKRSFANGCHLLHLGTCTAAMPDDGSIRTFLRIRPSRDPSGLFVQDEDDSSRLKFEIPVELKAGVLVNNTQTRHDFKFTNILGPLATQEEVFNMIGRDAVINVLDGYNSTIFAYGQTGSGKTFTVTGGAERYVDRGIIPRGLSLLFGEFRKRSDTQYTCHVSYLELYNEQV
jgi:kinesin family member 6/9